MKSLLIFFWLLVVFARPANGNQVLFDGYYKVQSGGVPVGYIIQTYEFDPKKNEYTSIYYLKTSVLGGDITESLKATASANLTPISYQYNSVVDKQVKSIKASFTQKKNKKDTVVTMDATINNNGKIEQISMPLPKRTFLATFLVYVMLQSDKGLKTGLKYDYAAVAEEDGKVFNGTAFVQSLEELEGIKAFRILNEYKNAKFISYVTEKGEALQTKSPLQSLSTELVKEPAKATQTFAVNTQNITLLFGKIPEGKNNVLNKQVKSSAPSAPSIKDKVVLPSSPTPAVNHMPTETTPTEGKASEK